LGGELVDLSTPLAAEEQAFRHTVGEFDLPPISSTEEAHPTAICASLRQRQGRTQQRNAIAFHDGRNVNGAELEQIQSDSHTYANTTNGEGQTLSVSQFEEVDGSPTSAPTLGDLQAMLLACESITQLLNLRSNHKEPFNQAYRSLSPEQQARFDGLLAARYNEPIYKYLGEERTADGYSLSHGDLVRLKDSKMRVGVVSVLPLDAPACGQNYQPTQFIDVNPKRLRLVEKLYPLPVGEQLNLLASPSNSVTEADS
ncbi:hypothetical protein, partial [Allocoleopsis sp.]|uniref:hypothetical protein n=1 Tax=Allocoleopsis sp. TaxID=3088169 RepID=UPI002FD0C2E8